MGQRKARWNDGMMTRIAMEEAMLKMAGARYMNMELHKTFPEYTVEMIKGVRNKKIRYAELLAQETEKLHQGAQPSEEETSDMATSEDVENINRSVDFSSWRESQSRVKA